MQNFANNSKGFLSLTFVFVLMAFISLYLTATFAIALSQQRDYVRTTCLNEATDNQVANLKNARLLFALNPESTLIRTGIKTTKAAIALALMTGQVQALERLQKILDGFYKAQNNLAVLQNNMIAKARIEFEARHLALKAKILSGQNETASSWRYMISMSSYFVSRSQPVFAIRPDSEGGVGPNYEWEENAESKIKLAYAWNMSFSTLTDYQKFFEWTNVLSLRCSVTADLKGKKWVLKINEAKSSLSTF